MLRMIPALILLAGLLGASCAGSSGVSFRPTVAAPHPMQYPIEIMTGAPFRPYEEVGLVRADAGVFGSEGATVEAVRREARKLGADAVIHFRMKSERSASLNYGTYIFRAASSRWLYGVGAGIGQPLKHTVVTGVAVRYIP